MAAAIALALQLIPIAESLISKIIATINRAKAAGHELTPEEEAKFQSLKNKLQASAHWQVGPDPVTPV